MPYYKQEQTQMKVAKLATKVESINDSDISGIANSLTMTRSGIRVTEDAGKQVVGQTVPLMMAHDWSKLSIGSATMTNIDEEGLHYKGTIFQNAPDRDLLLEGIKAGTNHVSIGFGLDNIDKDGNIDSIDLLELSITSIPADPKATAEIITQALEENIKMADQEPVPTPTNDKQPTTQDVLDAIADVKKDLEDFIKSQEPTDKPAEPKPDNATESVDELVSFVKKLSVSDNMQALRLGKILKKFDKQ